MEVLYGTEVLRFSCARSGTHRVFPCEGSCRWGFGEIDDDLIDDEGSEGAVNNDDTGSDSPLMTRARTR